MPNHLPCAARALAGRGDQPQHRRVQRVDPRRRRRIAAIGGERILAEVVGADREEIGLGGEAGRRARPRPASRSSRRAAPASTPSASAASSSAARTARSSPTSTTIGTMIRTSPPGAARRIARSWARSRSGRREAEPDAAQAERRIVLRRHGEIGQRLVAAGVERADDQRPAGQARARRPHRRAACSSSDGAVRAVVEQEFGAQQAAAFGAGGDRAPRRRPTEARLAKISMRVPSAMRQSSAAAAASAARRAACAIDALPRAALERRRRRARRRASRRSASRITVGALGDRSTLVARPRPASARPPRRPGSRHARSGRRARCRCRRPGRGRAPSTATGSRVSASRIAPSGSGGAMPAARVAGRARRAPGARDRCRSSIRSISRRCRSPERAAAFASIAARQAKPALRPGGDLRPRRRRAAPDRRAGPDAPRRCPLGRDKRRGRADSAAARRGQSAAAPARHPAPCSRTSGTARTRSCAAGPTARPGAAQTPCSRPALGRTPAATTAAGAASGPRRGRLSISAARAATAAAASAPLRGQRRLVALPQPQRHQRHRAARIGRLALRARARPPPRTLRPSRRSARPGRAWMPLAALMTISAVLTAPARGLVRSARARPSPRRSARRRDRPVNARAARQR